MTPNPKIRELIVGMGIIPESEHYDIAELIVKQMLQTCEDHPAWTGRMIGEKIKQHFGVEE